MTSADGVGACAGQAYGNVEPLLHEIVHALDRLLEGGGPTVIDLATLPFGPGELDRLQARLGRGELNAELDALGASHIRETAYPGVWWLEHHNASGELLGRYLEISHTPDILAAQDADILAGRARLREQLERGQPMPAALNDGDPRSET